ncbi:MAG: FKBP-type peptidyl-prolyl cis-trans isomerase [Bacteroidales bacterium]|nr:FKBP-type peptidyl-prolyl cis-trans isomerase [Candidatus Colimorpha onthohippi]
MNSPTTITGLCAARWFAIAACCLIWAACGEPPILNENNDANANGNLKERMINANRYVIEHEETAINGYIERRQWAVSELSCGARLHLYKNGDGNTIQNDETIVVQYSVETLDGQTLYPSKQDTLIAGRLLPTEGLDAAILHMSHGSKAHVVVPSNVAYGVVGDQDRIPSRTPIVYDITIE